MDRKDLKNQALLEKISSLVTSYENQVADLRVEITMLSQEIKEKDDILEELRNEESQEA